MNSTFEPRSSIKQSTVWRSPFRRQKSVKWNFLPKRQRGSLAEMPDKIKCLKVGGDKYKFGQYTGTLKEIKEFARIKGINSLKMGGITIKTV